ncbi:hypothetical protein B484DRAFT_452625 [Ochromonadaceae sp. CCMP2298]|nr:hypothetical protein B484DRAFT_452625 [Ochromonadaceae sp. CCMP2298]
MGSSGFSRKMRTMPLVMCGSRVAVRNSWSFSAFFARACFLSSSSCPIVSMAEGASGSACAGRGSLASAASGSALASGTCASTPTSPPTASASTLGRACLFCLADAHSSPSQPMLCPRLASTAATACCAASSTACSPTALTLQTEQRPPLWASRISRTPALVSSMYSGALSELAASESPGGLSIVCMLAV